jgi:hypothetical protein
MNFWNELKRAMPRLPSINLWMLPDTGGAEGVPLNGRVVRDDRGRTRAATVRVIFLNGKRVCVR